MDAVAAAKSEVRAAYAANFIAKQPGLEDEKNTVMQELLSRNPRWIAAISNLVEFANDETFERLVAYVLCNPDVPGIHGVAYRLAEHFPDRMRAYRKQLARYDLFELLLSGASDSWVKMLVTRYRRTGDGQSAMWLAKIGTESARQALARLESEASSSRKGFFAALLG